MLSAVFQCDGGGLTPEERLEKLAAVLELNRLDLIVCPELFLSGYNVGNALFDLAQAPDSALNQQMAQIARHSKTAIVYGYPERDGDRLYNAAACISAQGKIIARQRKLALPPGFEAEVFGSGDSFCLFELVGFRCAILICYDAEFPEAARALAQAGAQLVIVPTALTHEWGIVAERVMPTRAFENGIWLIYANHAGVENGARYLGASCIISPDGTDAARAGADEQLISAEIDSAQVLAAQNRLPYLKDVADLNKKLITPQ